MHSTRKALLSLARYYWGGPNRSYCSSSRRRNGSKPSYLLETSGAGDKGESSISHYHETYKQLDKLDFMTAAKILFSETPRKKKFGLDFHLVQLFFACMPSLAVYLVARYARYEMRRMEAELEQKEKEEEEMKLKEMESEAGEESDSEKQLAEMKVRLNKLEEAVKEISVETKKMTSADPPERNKDAAKKDQPEDASSDSPKVTVSPMKDLKSNTENGKPSRDKKS